MSVLPSWLSLENAYNLIIGILDSADYVEFIEFIVNFKKLLLITRRSIR